VMRRDHTPATIFRRRKHPEETWIRNAEQGLDPFSFHQLQDTLGYEYGHDRISGVVNFAAIILMREPLV
jgi:hypothetical protein